MSERTPDTDNESPPESEPATVPDTQAEPAATATEAEPAAPAEPDLAPADQPEAVAAEAETTPAVAAARRTRSRKPKAAEPAPVQPAARSPRQYAIIETGGKQYRVSVGDQLSVERLAAEAGTDVTIDRVLLLGGDGATRVGTPVVPGAAVTARVDDHLRGEKIVVFKYKAKKRYRRRMGHRQSLTRLTITAIAG